MISDRERFLALLFTGPLSRADAVCVFAGEDALPRLAVAAEMFRQGAAPVVLLSGGRHEPPRHQSASKLLGPLMGMGVAPSKIEIDDGPQHTRAQATALVAMAKSKGWGRVLLVASAYHLPRAYLTVVEALAEDDALDAVHVVPVPTSQTRWFACPEGATETRSALLGVELEKVSDYGEIGHCASYSGGLDYLARWEGR